MGTRHEGYVLLAFFLVLTISTANGQTHVCTTSLPTNGGGILMDLETEVIVNPGAVTGSPVNYTVNQDAISKSGLYSYLNGFPGPDLILQFYVEESDFTVRPAKVNITLVLTLISTSLGTISNASLQINLGTELQAIWGSGVAGATVSNRDYVEYYTGPISNPGENAILWFEAELAGKGGTGLPEGLTDFFANVSVESGGVNYTQVTPYFCLERVTTIIPSIIYEQGFTALAFFIFLLVGAALAALGVFLFLMIRRRRREATISPSSDKKLKSKDKKIVMDAKAAMKKGNNAIKDFSLMAWDDSFIFVLGMKDKLHMFREVDSLDILSTINVDTDLETEQNDAAVQSSLLLVQGLRHNGDITKATEDKTNSKFQTQLKDLDKKLETSYRKDLESVYKEIEVKNKEKLGELIKKHKQQRQDVLRLIKDMPEREKKQMLSLITQQQQTEENDLTFKLALEQNEKAESLRKEYAIRKRMAIKELQGNYIEDVVKEGQLNAQKADWLIKQHKEQQEKIHSMYDDEISQQRMILEEKLARRKALAKASENQEDDKTELLNTMGGIQMTLVTKLKKSSHLSSDEIDDYMKQARLDLEQVKNKMDADEETKMQEMFKRLSASKRKSLAEKMAEHETELKNYIAENKAQQTDGPVDPVSYVNGLVTIKSRQRKELAALENELDEAHAKKFEAMRDELCENAKDELKTMEKALIEKVKEDGLESDEINKILKAHEKNLSEITARQMANRKNQDAKLKDELARRKREWENRRAQEKQEQKDLREHESVIVEKLLSSQVSISDSERERILKEHEKQMVKLENSLTMSKLRQKRMLEEKIAQKRARQMENLEQKQSAEILKHRRIAENNGEEDDEETHERELALMKKHAQQKIALIQGQDFNIDDEMDEIRIEMTKERALALKEQEERLGALITSLQMDKAREMAKIDEQQKAIDNLKANLMDDLNARGILSTPECEKILSIHKDEREKLTMKLDGQRTKQEKMLKAKLAERIQQREKSMVQQQETEMQRMLEQASNKASAKIRRMLLMQKHLVEMEKFRNKLDREISQSLEDTKRNFEVQKQKIMQEQELQFIAGLIKVGDLTKNELMDVLHMLFPGKTEEAITEILNKVYDSSKPEKKGLERGDSTLADRIYLLKYSNPTPIHRRGSVMTEPVSIKDLKERKMSKKGSKASLLSDSYERLQYNEPTGRRDNTSKYYDEYEDTVDYVGLGVGAQEPQPASNFSGRLSPLREQMESTKGRKKKKRLLKKLAHHNDDIL